MARTDHIVMEADQMDENFNSANPIVRYVYNKRLKTVVDFVPEHGVAIVLDAGCGEGHLLNAIQVKHPNAQLHGVDITDIALERAAARISNGIFSKQDIEHLAYADNTFDVVCCVEVLEHIYEYESVCRELIRVTKPGGLIVIAFPNDVLWTVGRFFLRRKPYRVPDHVNYLSPNKMKKAFGLPIFRLAYIPRAPFFWAALNPVLVFKKPA